MSDTGHFGNIEKTKSDKFKTKSEKGRKYLLNCSINIEFNKNNLFKNKTSMLFLITFMGRVLSANTKVPKIKKQSAKNNY